MRPKRRLLGSDEKLAETGKPRRLILQDATSRKHMIRLMLNTAKGMTERDLAEQARLETERQTAEEKATQLVSEPAAEPPTHKVGGPGADVESADVEEGSLNS
jgi:hypothetical protein